MRRFFLSHYILFIGLKLTLFYVPWMLGDIRNKTHKIWVYLGEFDRLDLAWLRILGRDWKPPKNLNKSILVSFIRKVIP